MDRRAPRVPPDPGAAAGLYPHQIQLRVTEDMAMALKLLAIERQEPVTDIIRQAIAAELKRSHPQKPVVKIVAPTTRNGRHLNDDEWVTIARILDDGEPIDSIHAMVGYSLSTIYNARKTLEGDGWRCPLRYRVCPLCHDTFIVPPGGRSKYCHRPDCEREMGRLAMRKQRGSVEERARHGPYIQRPDTRPLHAFRPWTEDDLAYLHAHPDLSHRDIATALDRSVYSVMEKRAKLRQQPPRETTHA